MAKNKKEFIPQDGMTLKEVFIGLNLRLRSFKNSDKLVNLLTMGKYSFYLNNEMTQSLSFEEISLKELKILSKKGAYISEDTRRMNSFWINLSEQDSIDFTKM